MAKTPQGDWQDVTVESFEGGLNVAIRPELINNNDLLIASNVVLRQRRVQVDTGYNTFADTFRGTPQTDYQYYKKAGSSELILITTESIYKYNITGDAWQYIAAQTPTTVTTQANATDVTIEVADITGFTDNDYIGITLDDGTQHRTQVNGTPAAGIITFDDPIPTGRHSAFGALVILAVQLSGDLDYQISIVPIPSNDWIAFTNGIDLPLYYDGTICTTIPNLPAGFNSCRALAVYNASLFLLSTVEGGLHYPQRIRFSDIGNPSEWATGLSGYDDLYDGADFIVGSEVMGPYMIVYRERSIIKGQFVNTAGKTYEWVITVDGEGVSSTQSVVNLNAVHLIFANAGIYSYTGGYDIESIGDKIFYKVFSQSGDLNTAYRHRVFSVYIEELDEAWFFYPAGSSEYCNKLLRYNVGDDNWTVREFADNLISYGFYQSISAKRWVDLQGNWLAQSWRWDSRTVSSESPTTHLMSVTQNIVLEYDYAATSDDGTTIVATIETKDFFSTDWSMRFDMLQLYCKGIDILVEYSVDSGGNYITLGTITSTTLSIHTLTKQFVCDKIRFRMTCSNTGYEQGWLKFSYKEESPTMWRTS